MVHIIIINAAGWIGAFLIASAYFLLVHHDLTSRSKKYQWMNLFGAIFIGTNSYFNRAYPSFTINIVWILIAVYGLTKSFRKK